MATTARKTSSGTAPPDTDTSTGTAEAARTGLSRAVIWTGIALGTAVAVLAISGGARPQIGGPPSWLGAVLGVLLVYALIVGAAITVAELTRRHHKTARKYVARQGKRGALAAGRTARSRWRALTAWAAARWQARQAREAAPASPEDPDAEQPAPRPTRRPDGEPETAADKRFFDLRESGYTGPIDQDGYAVDEHTPTGGSTMAAQPAHSSRISPDRRARRAAARSGGTVPSEWAAVVATTADFEPENDGELLGWMARQVTGLSAWAEALVDTYEHCTQVIGIDPVASTMLHDVADAAAQAAETMGAAKARFTEHYELPREFAANGGLMTHDGRWVTGDGA
jgi:hypothetical protein